MPPVETLLSETRNTGKEWILMENFESATDKDYLLRHHCRLDEEFHGNYRLWIITKECSEVDLSSKQALFTNKLCFYSIQCCN